MKYVIGFSVLMSVLAISCVNEKQELLDMDPISMVCDTVEVSYQMDVVPIFENNCYRCHNNANADSRGAGIAFEAYDDTKAWAEIIVSAIQHGPGASNMPKGSAKLDDCTISIVEAWVRQGTLDN